MGFWDGQSYRLYTDRERREYGQKKRQEAFEAWHRTWLTKSTLKSNWNLTDKAISQYLNRLKLHDLGAGRFGTLRAYKVDSVKKVERENHDFQQWMGKRVEGQLKKKAAVIERLSSSSFAFKVVKELIDKNQI